MDVVDNGVDAAYFGSVEGPHTPNRVLFLGSLDWRPNQDAVRVLLDDIFSGGAGTSADGPVEHRGPEAAGMAKARPRGGVELLCVELHADVADVRPYLGVSGVMAVPLRIGGGSRLKILEALATGLPVVSTRVGAEGLRLQNGRDLTVVEGVEDMAAALVACIRSPEQARRTAEQGRRLVLEQYDWDVLADKLEAVWQGMVRGRQEAILVSDASQKRV